jgi:hypothetical protein
VTTEFDPERLLTALSGEVAVLRKRMDDLARTVGTIAVRQRAGGQDGLGERLDELAGRVAEIAAMQQEALDATGRGPVWDWTSMTAAEAAGAWRELVGWIDAVLLPRNPTLLVSSVQQAKLGGEWAPCWYLHPEAVDELSALYGMWRTAFTGVEASALRVAEWRDRWLPNTRARLRLILDRCNGIEGEHRPAEPRADRMTDRDALNAYIHQDLDQRATS